MHERMMRREATDVAVTPRQRCADSTAEAMPEVFRKLQWSIVECGDSKRPCYPDNPPR
jgi:hypothetical protein